MPPNDGHAKPLTSAEKDLIKQWIFEEAEYEKFWAFVPAKTQVPPEVNNTAWAKTDIDRFVLAQIEAEGKTLFPDSAFIEEAVG